MSEISETEIKSMSKEQNYMRGYEDGKSDVLDKIRAEISEIQLIGYATVDGKREIASRAVMQIIDKYRESEGYNETYN